MLRPRLLRSVTPVKPLAKRARRNISGGLRCHEGAEPESTSGSAAAAWRRSQGRLLAPAIAVPRDTAGAGAVPVLPEQ